MNNINFQQSIGFPLETNTFQEMQEAYRMFNAIGDLAGDKTIIKGCVENGQNISDGVIYLNGELFEFRGGVRQQSVVIKEEVTQVEFEDGENKDTYFNRYVEFGTGLDTYPWSDFKRVDNLVQVKQSFVDVNNEIVSTNTYIRNVDDDVDVNKSRITNLQNDLNTAKNRVTALENRVTQLENQTIHKEVKWVGRDVTNANLPPKWFIANGQNGTDNILGRMIIGKDINEWDFNSVGKRGGAKTHTLTIREMPSHSHRQLIVNDSLPGQNNNLDHLVNDTKNNDEAFRPHGYTEATGGGGAHNNMPPYITMIPIQYIQ